MAVTETFWCASTTAKLILSSGQFTSTIRASLTTATAIQDISWDGSNTLWCASTVDKLYLQSGAFSSTIKSSLSTVAIATGPIGIDKDINGDTPWSSFNSADMFYLQSGAFSSTVKSSLNVAGVVDTPHAISVNNIRGSTFSGDFTTSKLFELSGIFTATIKQSLSVSAVSAQFTGGVYDGTNVPWSALIDEKLYLQSGYFTSTIKTSLSVTGSIRGVDVDDYQTRQGVDQSPQPPPGGGGRPTTSRGRILTARDDRKLREKIESELRDVEEIKIDTAPIARILDIIFREVDQEKAVEEARKEERITQIIRETISFEHKQRGVEEQLAAIKQLRKDVSKGNKDIEALIALLLARLL